MMQAVLLGIVVGVVGFLPLFVAIRVSKSHPSTSTFSTAAAGLLGVFVSFVVLGAALIVCSRVAREFVLPFGLTEIVVFVIISVAYFVTYSGVMRRQSRGERERE